jgi:uncharacterized protein YuzE
MIITAHTAEVELGEVLIWLDELDNHWYLEYLNLTSDKINYTIVPSFKDALLTAKDMADEMFYDLKKHGKVAPIKFTFLDPLSAEYQDITDEASQVLMTLKYS